ncbi:hypothetical protein QL285_014542 [Trifolium repens]|jgi:hypothetical protein|nr:hypothetical protein QL285_014542 [Trifolium repens]
MGVSHLRGFTPAAAAQRLDFEQATKSWRSCRESRPAAAVTPRTCKGKASHLRAKHVAGSIIRGSSHLREQGLAAARKARKSARPTECWRSCEGMCPQLRATRDLPYLLKFKLNLLNRLISFRFLDHILGYFSCNLGFLGRI